jgi:hypothetical protein
MTHEYESLIVAVTCQLVVVLVRVGASVVLVVVTLRWSCWWLVCLVCLLVACLSSWVVGFERM